MAGVVAMASVIEDFDTQPCKKTCKDVDSPVGKTITNYFSPVAKPVEKPFSPPRSNNIMDYFNRKGLPQKNTALSPNQVKENCLEASVQTTPVVHKHLAQKRNKKASKTARKLVETREDSDCIVFAENDEENGMCGVLGSDTAILLGQICAETSASSAMSNYKCGASNQQKKTPLAKCDPLNSIDLSPILPPKDKPRKAKTPVRISKNIKTLEDNLPEPEVQERKTSLSDLSMEVNVGDASQLNTSTVTISFEDFVRSQDTSHNDLCERPDSVANDDQLQNTDDEESQPKETCLQVSPRTVTIQAEVHARLQKPVKSAGKVASIFTKEKVVSSGQVISTQTESSQTSSKWKSNVVLQEQDVELCVLESSSAPKCSQVERKQFMAAFKQPSLDGNKNKPTKSQAKQKQSGDKTADTTDKDGEEDPEIQSVTVLGTSTSTSQEHKECKRKPTSKRQKKATDKENITSSPAAAVEENPGLIDVDKDSNQDEPIASTPSVFTVRRSRRAALARQTAKVAVTESPLKNNCKNESAEVSPAKKRKSKHGVFEAEMLSAPDQIESPIRIRFKRVSTGRSKEKHSVSNLSTKNTKGSKKAEQAKKLLEKAKAMKQNKAPTEEKTTLRRSSRTEASTKHSYCEDEDSIICVEDIQEMTAVPEKSKSKRALRSLNDVLGKAAPVKEAASGSKVCQDKSSRKPPPVSIFEETSRDGSDNSQDNEQFKARREFLKSGLPESFKKQMAKTAAAKEAYVTACSSFQPVTHITQASDDCALWNLPWPQSAFFNHLKEIQFQFSNICIETSAFSKQKTQPVHRVMSEKVSVWRPEISVGVREELMKEISGSNPTFPVQKFMSHFLKKQAEFIQQCAASELSLTTKAFSVEATGGKRKRAEDEGETVKVAKKQRSSHSVEDAAQGALAKKKGRPKRGAKSVSKVDGKESDASQTALVQPEDEAVIVLDDSPGPKALTKPELTEDTLWTEKYQPQHSSEVVGNAASVRRLYSWLKEWKLRADKEDKKKQKDQRQEEGSIDSDWECGEEDSRDAEDLLCNTMLITGPTGVGKTAAVYACAQELGFKVFEVNSSSQRSGRLILSQLKEATQSHQVGSQGVSAHKPSYFNSYGASGSAGRLGTSPRKVNSPRRAVSSPRKPPQSPRGTKRGGLAPTALANFFKMSKPSNKEKPGIKEEQTASSKKKPHEVDTKKTSIQSPPDSYSKDSNPEELSKKTATSLILFEEVDVIFDDDLGFLSAIKTFMTTTKRPVILTTSDPGFSAMFDGDFEEIVFEAPREEDVASYLQLLCLAEDMRTDLKDVNALLSLNSCDIRRTLLQLQFWTRSRTVHNSPNSAPNEVLQQQTQDSVAVLTEMKDLAPLPNTGCTESMLGLLNITPQNIWEQLKKQEDDCSKLVAMGRRQGVDLLYSNIETLLPLPITTLTMSNYKQQPFILAQDRPVDNPSEVGKLPSQAELLNIDENFSDEASPVKVSNRMKKNRRKQFQPEQVTLQSDSDSDDAFLSIKQKSTQVKEPVTVMPVKVMKRPLSREDLIKSVPVSQCLRSMADFLDDLSFVDLLSNEDTNVKDLSSTVGVKDGLTDEARIDTERSGPLLECAEEISAHVQTLGFSKCCRSVSDAWNNIQQLDEKLREEAAAQLTIPVVNHNEGFTFTQHGLWQTRVVKQRREVMHDLDVKGVFGSMGNRAAAAQDYLPALRTICKSELLKEQGKVKRRFLHYLDAIHLDLQKSTLERLAEDFP